MCGSENSICRPQALARGGCSHSSELYDRERMRCRHIIKQTRRLGLMDKPVRMLDADSGKFDWGASAMQPAGCLILKSPSIPQRQHLGLVRCRENRTGFPPSGEGHVRDGYSKPDSEARLQETGA